MKPFIPQHLPIKDIDWESLIPLIGRANRSIALYHGILYGVPNPGVLLSPLTTQEAVLSSKIEGTVATLGEVLEFEAGEEPEQESKRHDIFEIINYRKALQHAEAQLKIRPFSLNLLLALHSILLNSVRGANKSRGRFSQTQNWIGAPGTAIDSADFIPPDPTLIQSALDEWERYYHAERPDPLVQLAVVHAQFEIIHPFLDGNGRLGRILIPLFLYEKHLLQRPIFYLSAYLEENRDEYIQRLRALGRKDDAWSAWIKFFLIAIDRQAQINAQKARDIIDLYEALKSQLIEITHSQYAVPLLDKIFEKPIFQSSHLKFGENRSPSRQAISSLVRTLLKNRIVKIIRKGGGRRGHTFAFPKLLNLCEGRDVF
ncbi:MAG: Fic family protein [Alphaproteobacteria bacterium]|nr:Fic family protein [Alphaproteobacteria bacterium]